MKHDLDGSGETAAPMPRKNGQRTVPGCVLAHGSTRAMGHHKTVGKEEILTLEQNIITLALTLCSNHRLEQQLSPISLDT